MKKVLLVLIATIIVLPFARASEYYYNLNDKKFTYDELIAKPKTILFVWATWCPTCRKRVQEFTKEGNTRNDVNIVFLESGEARSVVLKTMKELDVPQSKQNLFYRDPFQEINHRFFISTVPTVMFFQDGRVVKTTHGLTARLIEQVYPQEKNKVSDAHHK